MPEKRYAGGVKSAMRVVEILDLFEAKRTELGVQEMVNALDLPQSSVSTLIKTLVAEGYLSFNSTTRKYRPSERLAFLGQWALGSPDSMRAIQTLMRTLSEETGESILLGGQSGLLMRYLWFVESPHHLRFTLRPNQTRPIHGCGLGIMLLTRYSDQIVGATVRRYNAEFPSNSKAGTQSKTIELVRSARAQGYFETFGMVTQDVGTISTLLPEKANTPSLAIGFGGPLVRLDKKRSWLIQTLMDRAQAFTWE